MDDDTRVFKIQIKGTAYEFRPIPEDSLTRVHMMGSLSVSQLKVVKTLTAALAESAGPEQWDAITDRYGAGEVTEREITIDLYRSILERMSEETKPKPPRKAAKATRARTTRAK